MKKLSMVLITLLSSAAVFAQAEPAGRDIVVNTDPDKVAEVERHAQELREKQEAAINAAEPTAAGPKSKTKRHHKQMQKQAPKPDMAKPDNMTMPEGAKPDMPPPAAQ